MASNGRALGAKYMASNGRGDKIGVEWGKTE